MKASDIRKTMTDAGIDLDATKEAMERANAEAIYAERPVMTDAAMEMLAGLRYTWLEILNTKANFGLKCRDLLTVTLNGQARTEQPVVGSMVVSVVKDATGLWRKVARSGVTIIFR